MSDDNHVPASADAYRADLPQIDGIPAGTKIDTAHPRYREAAAQAHKAGLTQRQFTAFLGFEAQRVAAAAKAATPPAKATPVATAKPTAGAATPLKIEGYAKMTMAQKLAAAGHL